MSIAAAMPGANTLAALAGCAMLGAAAGVTGCFVIARRRALVSDVAGHATLPGACLGFLAANALLPDAVAAWAMPACAAATAIIASWATGALARLPRIGSDGAAAVALAGFFGLGAVLLSVVQSHVPAAEGGATIGSLRQILLGNAAAMTRADLALVAALALSTCIAAALLFKELAAVSFDEAHARLAGIPARGIDRVLSALTVATVVAGMQVVGVVLVVALLLAPAAAARQLARSSAGMAWTAGALGALAGAAGVAISGALADIPTGSAITLCAFAVFAGAVALRSASRGGAPA